MRFLVILFIDITFGIALHFLPFQWLVTCLQMYYYTLKVRHCVPIDELVNMKNNSKYKIGIISPNLNLLIAILFECTFKVNR